MYFINGDEEPSRSRRGNRRGTQRVDKLPGNWYGNPIIESAGWFGTNEINYLVWSCDTGPVNAVARAHPPAWLLACLLARLHVQWLVPRSQRCSLPPSTRWARRTMLLSPCSPDWSHFFTRLTFPTLYPVSRYGKSSFTSTHREWTVHNAIEHHCCSSLSMIFLVLYWSYTVLVSATVLILMSKKRTSISLSSVKGRRESDALR